MSKTKPLASSLQNKWNDLGTDRRRKGRKEGEVEERKGKRRDKSDRPGSGRRYQAPLSAELSDHMVGAVGSRPRVCGRREHISSLEGELQKENMLKSQRQRGTW